MKTRPRDVEIFFPQSGLLKGIADFQKLNEELVKSIRSLKHDIDNFIYTISENRVVVEGKESGTLQNNQSFIDNKFCSVFEIHDNLITRMHVYTDPNFKTDYV